MKRAYWASQYGKPYERYCRERYPEEAEAICREADARYRAFCREMPDLGRNLMAANMLDWFTILAFYEASGHRLDGEALLASGAVADTDSVFCQAFGFAVLKKDAG